MLANTSRHVAPPGVVSAAGQWSAFNRAQASALVGSVSVTSLPASVVGTTGGTGGRGVQENISTAKTISPCKRMIDP